MSASSSWLDVCNFEPSRKKERRFTNPEQAAKDQQEKTPNDAEDDSFADEVRVGGKRQQAAAAPSQKKDQTGKGKGKRGEGGGAANEGEKVSEHVGGRKEAQTSWGY